MQDFRKAKGAYFETIAERKKTTRVYRDFQLIGLEVAALLDDAAHKALYIKLAKQFGKDAVLTIAKNVAESRTVRNKGAYFMKLLYADTPHPHHQ